jgi:hypothetical protein
MHISERKKVLEALQKTNDNLQLAQYLELVNMLMDNNSSDSESSNKSSSDELDSDLDSDSDLLAVETKRQVSAL